MDEYAGALQILEMIKTNSKIVEKAKNSLLLFGVISDKSQFPDFRSKFDAPENLVEDAVHEKKRRLNSSSA